MNLVGVFRIALTILSAVFFSLPSSIEACSCARPPTIADEFAESRAVFTGRVLYTNRSMKKNWLKLKYGVADWLSISGLEYVPRRDGVSVTFEVTNAWKGLEENNITLVTGYGGGDCGVPFEAGSEYLVFVHQYNDFWEDVSICSRTQPLTVAAADLAALGPPLKLVHKSIAFHFVKSHILSIVLITIFAASIFVYLRVRKRK